MTNSAQYFLYRRFEARFENLSDSSWIKFMEDTRDYNDYTHADFLRALTCRKLDEIIDQNKKVIGLLEKISKQWKLAWMEIYWE